MLDFSDDYRCEVCSSTRRLSFKVDRLRDVPESVACHCGARSVPVEREWPDIEILHRGKELPFKKPVATPGWERGVTPAQAERAYSREVEFKRKLVRRESRGSHKKGEVRVAAEIPVPLLKARMNEFGKDYWVREGKAALKRDGLYLGND